MVTTINKEITLDLLNEKSVSVKTVEKANINSEERIIGTNRNAYANSPIGRQQIVKELPEQYVNAVMAVWGNEPTVDDPEPPIVENDEV